MPCAQFISKQEASKQEKKNRAIAYVDLLKMHLILYSLPCEKDVLPRIVLHPTRLTTSLSSGALCFKQFLSIFQLASQDLSAIHGASHGYHERRFSND